MPIATNTAFVAAAVAASSASNSASLSNSTNNQALLEPASAYVECERPANDGCLVNVTPQNWTETVRKYTWESYAAWKLGYPVKLVGIQYMYFARDRIRNRVVIYVREEK